MKEPGRPQDDAGPYKKRIHCRPVIARARHRPLACKAFGDATYLMLFVLFNALLAPASHLPPCIRRVNLASVPGNPLYAVQFVRLFHPEVVVVRQDDDLVFYRLDRLRGHDKRVRAW